jgi:hypothetical protein
VGDTTGDPRLEVGVALLTGACRRHKWIARSLIALFR